MLNLGPNPLSLCRLNFLASPPWKVEPGEEVFDWVWNPGHHLLRHRNPSKIEYDRSPKPHQTPTTNSKHAPNIENQHILKLDQVYCAWLIKWWIISGTWWYWVSIWRYWLVLGQYKLVLLGIRWYMVSKGLVCLYILEKVEIWSGDTDAWHTHSLTDNRI